MNTENKYEKFNKFADRILFNEKRIGVLVMKELTAKNDGHIVNNEYNKIVIECLKRLPFGELKERSEAEEYDFNSHLLDVASDESANLTERDKWFILRQHADIENLDKYSLNNARYEFEQDIKDCILAVMKETSNDIKKSKAKGMER